MLFKYFNLDYINLRVNIKNKLHIQLFTESRNGDHQRLQ